MKRLVLPAVVSIVACAGDLVKPDAGLDPGSGRFVHTMNGDGTTNTTVDASSETEWYFIDLESQREIMTRAPESSRDWDLGFNRFRVRSNGGIGGSGGMEVAIVPNADFA